MEALRSLFKEEIAHKLISIGCVRSKIQEHHLLGGEEPKRVYDHVRAEWRYSAPDTGAELPKAEETLVERVQRVMAPEASILQEDDNSSVDIIPPTVESVNQSLFSSTNVETLHQLSGNMIYKNSPISKVHLEQQLAGDSRGEELLQKLTLSQIVNRVKYERRMDRISKH